MFEGVFEQNVVIMPKAKRNLKKAVFYSVIWTLSALVLSGLIYGILSFISMSRGDINHDGSIDSKDAAILAENRSSGELVPGDMNGDGIVDNEDLRLLLNDYSSKALYTMDAPKASVATPYKVVQKPIVLTQ